MVEEASGADAEVQDEVEVEDEIEVDDEVEVEDEVELGELVVRLVNRAPVEGTKGIPAPLATPNAQS